MMKVFKSFLIVSVGISFGLLFINYKEFNQKKKDLIVIKKELLQLNKSYNEVLGKIKRISLEEDTLKIEKEKEVKEYQKWVRQNQGLEELLK